MRIRTRTRKPPASGPGARGDQRGVSLIVVLLILVVVSILGVGGAQIAQMGERSARNDRDMQIAWQSSEAALQDAEFDIGGQPPSSRAAIFAKGKEDRSAFLPGCGSSDNSKGLCAFDPGVYPVWLTVDLLGNAVALYGDFTGRAFAADNASIATGIQPARKPRYVIEILPDPGGSRDQSVGAAGYVYRVTAMGFGPRQDIQAVTQTIYRN